MTFLPIPTNYEKTRMDFNEISTENEHKIF